MAFFGLGNASGATREDATVKHGQRCQVQELVGMEAGLWSNFISFWFATNLKNLNLGQVSKAFSSLKSVGGVSLTDAWSQQIETTNQIQSEYFSEDWSSIVWLPERARFFAIWAKNATLAHRILADPILNSGALCSVSSSTIPMYGSLVDFGWLW